MFLFFKFPSRWDVKTDAMASCVAVLVAMPVDYGAHAVPQYMNRLAHD